jgi:LDH2 family malate/lactate/ureidoglycolate dehydrogenase
MLALNIEAFQPLGEFNARMERYIETIKAVPLAEGASEVFYPGELEARAHARQMEEGIVLPGETLLGLDRVAREAHLGLIERG